MKLLVLLFLLTGIGCADVTHENTDDFYARLKSAPWTNDTQTFPEWLLVKIGEIETIHSKDTSIVYIQIFKGEWKENAVYFIHHNLTSCLLCDVYFEDGKQIDWSTEDISDFDATSKNWQVIYEFGERPVNGLFAYSQTDIKNVYEFPVDLKCRDIISMSAERLDKVVESRIGKQLKAGLINDERLIEKIWSICI